MPKNPKKPVISVIIVNFNARKYLNKCINSIRKQKISLEIIIVDNNSRDDSLIYIRKKHPDIKLIISKYNMGFGKAVNQAVKFAHGKYLLSINPDMILGNNYLSRLISIMEIDHKIGAIQGKISYQFANTKKYLHGLRFNKWGLFMNADIKFSNDYRKVFSVQVPIIRKSVFKKIGGYDEFYWLYYEDIDLSWRIWLRGLQVICFPKVEIYHKHDHKQTLLNHHKYQQAINNSLYTFVKNYELPNLIKASLSRLIIAQLNFWYYLISGKLNLSLMHMKAWAQTALNLKKILQQRKQVQRYRHVSDEYIFDQCGRRLTIMDICTNILFWLRTDKA